MTAPSLALLGILDAGTTTELVDQADWQRFERIIEGNPPILGTYSDEVRFRTLSDRADRLLILEHVLPSTKAKLGRFSAIKMSTLLTENQLQGHGLHLVGSRQAEQWLVPIDSISPPNTAATRPAWYEELSKRLSELEDLACEEESVFSDASAQEALAFSAKIISSQRPSAFLLGNGNIRLVWRNTAHEQIGLQFLGSNIIQFVLLVKREGVLLERLGRDTPSEVMQLVTATKLSHLLK